MEENSKLNQDEETKSESGYLQRWLDDDDWKGPFVPFFGRNR